MDYDDFVATLREHLEDEKSGYEFELARLPFWEEVEHPTVVGKRFREELGEKFPEIECIGKPKNDNHFWYKKR